jgi:asparagine synthase (glutamine-hydrolysing)
MSSDQVVLGQARLSIIDLAGGHQPLSNETGTVWITLNGEIYNYRELRDELIRRGHHFKTATDTEVIVHLYEERGIACLHELNGMFAFALWDADRRTLFLARDRLGIKPLYYQVTARRLAFASELKALLTIPGVAREVDREAVAEYLVMGYVHEPRTPFVNIRKLRAASYVEWREGHVREERYWQVPTVSHLDTPIPTLVDELLYLLEDATRLQMRADVPVGVFASGGLDSSAIMWAAARQGVSVQAFVCEFDYLKADTPYARMAAAATGARLEERHLGAASAWKLLPRLVWHLDEPLADPAIVPCYLIAREARDTVKVILNGTGGDELFGGYPRYNVRGVLPFVAAQRVGAALGRLSGGSSTLGRAAAALDYRERYLRRITFLWEGDVRRALGLGSDLPVTDRIRSLFGAAQRLDTTGSMMYVDLHEYLPGDLFMLLDKMTMAASLEARVPLLDHRLVEFAARIPGHIKMRGGQLKWLLREALRGRLPDELLDRPKQGFGPPVTAWLGGDAGEAATRFLTERASRSCALVPEAAVRRWLTPSALRRRRATVLWALLVLELWSLIFVEGETLDSADAMVGGLTGAAA